LAILFLFGLVQPFYRLQESIAFGIGQVHASNLTLTGAFLLSLILYWLSRNLLVIIRLWLRTGSGLPPATEVRLYKLCGPLLFSTSVLLVLQVLHEPEATCLVTGFGDNGLNLELRVWINDPQNGLGPVKNELLRGILRRFKDEGIELPFPQMVLHHKSMPGGPDSD
jgi:small-conductance mechanosensitive channel